MRHLRNWLPPLAFALWTYSFAEGHDWTSFLGASLMALITGMRIVRHD